jgi:hypothetical protein
MIICSLQHDYPKNPFLEACKSDSINYGPLLLIAFMLTHPLNDNNRRCVIINFTRSSYTFT